MVRYVRLVSGGGRRSKHDDSEICSIAGYTGLSSKQISVDTGNALAMLYAGSFRVN